jgi:diphosphomevalonate decarboxylase
LEPTNFIFRKETTKVDRGSISWKSPSNIALVKYWGKLSPQIPKNPSLSLTLDACFTLTSLEYNLNQNTEGSKEIFNFEIFFDGNKKDDFKPKINTFFRRIEKYVPFIKDYSFIIKTRNSFPHSSGIASSASGMSALALCIMSMEKELDQDMTEAYFYKKASFLARLGSGSASRSIKGNVVVWGKHNTIPNSSDLFGVQLPFKIHSIFRNLHDTILLVDKGQKQVSSTLGHNLMQDHPFAEKRFLQAGDNLTELSSILQNGNIDRFIEIVESEALTLHAMMLTSNPYFILMQPNTLAIIHKIWKFRKKTNAKICFTLDAGANVHVLYPEKEKEVINNFIIKELIPHCENNQYICDRIGEGSRLLSF